MIDYCRSEYQTNSTMLQQIDEFEKNYKSENAIEWYTKDSFVHRLVNRSLRTENINALTKLGFFIRDLSTSLKVKQENGVSHNNSGMVTVFRGTQLTDNEITKLKPGSLITTNGYLSTTRSLETACVYASNIVFYIEIDPSVGNLIFIDITEYSQFPEEEEVLFDLGSMFQIISVEYDETKQRSIVKMISANEGEKIANDYIKTIKDRKKTKGYFDGLLSDFVHQVSLKKFLQIYEHYLTVSTNDGTKIIKNLSKFLKVYEKCCDTSNITILFGSMGWFFMQRAEYDLAIEYCTHALLTVEKLSLSDNIDIEIAVIHNTIGWSYYGKGDYDLALNWCHKAENILERCSYVEYSKYAKILRTEQKIEKCSSRNDKDYAEILTCLGYIYYKKNDFDLAMSHCTKSMNILVACNSEIVFDDHHETTTSNYALDNHHEIIAANYEVFAEIHYQNGNYALALKYFRDALEICEQKIPNIPICLQRSPHIFGRNKQRLQNSILITEEQTLTT
ncbi:unnamed protein product [Adineta steineri]|uniref:ADP ribosyltransferase domain-containing protein n=1 Tax=Adineta steineri TaxID=433720 RepID=A0A814F4R4_9BILA|nr:unnamed protein product [Adineta steineri]CAF3934625.1 unnamed protein product [Adineta steineri]